MPIPPEHLELWNRLQAFTFADAEAQLDLPARLARENGWSAKFTANVLEEYRRFLFLAATGTGSVTPSDAVDQAWHLHLAYTDSYWHDLCRDTLEVDVHHGPTRGGMDESAKFRGWYTRTLKEYAAVFDAAPPRRIWPSAKRRFADAEYFVRVNRRRSLLIPAWLGTLFAFLAVPPTALGILLITSNLFAVPPLPIAGPQRTLLAAGVLAGLGVAVILTIAITSAMRPGPPARRRSGGYLGASCGTGCGGGCGGCGGGGC